MSNQCAQTHSDFLKLALHSFESEKSIAKQNETVRVRVKKNVCLLHFCQPWIKQTKFDIINVPSYIFLICGLRYLLSTIINKSLMPAAVNYYIGYINFVQPLSFHSSLNLSFCGKIFREKIKKIETKRAARSPIAHRRRLMTCLTLCQSFKNVGKLQLLIHWLLTKMIYSVQYYYYYYPMINGGCSLLSTALRDCSQNSIKGLCYIVSSIIIIIIIIIIFSMVGVVC